MSKEELHNDMLYHAAISMAKSMLEKGLITEGNTLKLIQFCSKNTGHIWVHYYRKTLDIPAF